MKNVNNPEDYEFSPYNKCLKQGCNNYPEYFIDKDLQLGLCPECFEELEKENKTRGNEE